MLPVHIKHTQCMYLDIGCDVRQYARKQNIAAAEDEQPVNVFLYYANYPGHDSSAKISGRKVEMKAKKSPASVAGLFL